MRNTFKRLIALSFVLAMLLSMLMLSSCAIDFRNKVEKKFDKILTADSYTVVASYDDGSSYEFRLMGGAVYYITDYDGIKTTAYLFYDEAQSKYFIYSVADDGETKTKEKQELTEAEYIITFASLEATLGFSKYAFQYRQILDMADNEDNTYKYSTVTKSGTLSYRNTYTIESNKNGLVYTYEIQGKGVEEENTIEVSGINKTEFTIPSEAFSAEVTEK